MKKIIKLLILILILAPNKDIYSQDDKKSSKTDEKNKTKSFASIVSKAIKDEGLFNIYVKDDKYYYNEKKMCLVGKRKGTEFFLGDDISCICFIVLVKLFDKSNLLPRNLDNSLSNSVLLNSSSQL